MGVDPITGLLAVAALASAGSIVEQRKAQKAQEKANRVRRRQARAETIREKRRQLQQARLQQSLVSNVAAQTGTQGSSSAVQAKGSTQTQAGTNISFLDQSFQRSSSIFRQENRASRAQFRAGIFSTIASLASGAATQRAQAQQAQQ